MIATKRPRAKLSDPIPPCARCRTKGGYTPADCHRPERYSGERYGIAGKLCRRCYDQVKRPRTKPKRTAKPLSLPTVTRRITAAVAERYEREKCVIPARIAALRAAKDAARARGQLELTPEDLAALTLPGDAA